MSDKRNDEEQKRPQKAYHTDRLPFPCRAYGDRYGVYDRLSDNGDALI